MQYGLPQRSALQDANEGKINPPALKRDTSVATTRETQQLSDVHLGELNVGRELGSVLGSFITHHAEDLYARQKLEVATRKGLDEGINEVDKANERTGFMDTIFGQHAGYREAQQRAVETRVHKDYMRVQSELDNYAGSTPEEFHKQVIAPKLTELAELYKGDDETRQLAETTFIDNAQKLIKQQQADYIAYGVEQNKQTTIDSINVRIDQYQLEKSKMVDPEDMIKADETIIKDFQKSTIGATDIATKQMQFEVIDQQLKAGNIGMYTLLKNDGWEDSLTPVQKAKIDQAVVHYDSKHGQEVSLVKTQTAAAMLDATSVADIDAAEQVYVQRMEELSKRSSNSITSKQNMLGSDIAVTKTGDSYRKAFLKQAQKMREDGEKAVMERMTEQRELDMITSAVSDPQAMEAYIQENGKEMSKADRDRGMTNSIMMNLQSALGENAPKDMFELRARIAEPDVLNTVLPALRNFGDHTPSFVNRLVNDFVSSPEFFMNEDGQVNMQQVSAYMPVLDKLTGEGRLGRMTDTQQMNIAWMQDQLRSGASLKKIQEGQKNRANNSTNKPAKLKDYTYVPKGATFKWEESINNELADIGITNPTQMDRIEWEDRWEEAMKVSNYEPDVAKTLVAQIYANQTEKVGSARILDGNTYFRETNVSVSQSLKNVFNDGMNEKARRLFSQLDPTAKEYLDPSRMKGLDIKMDNIGRTVTIRAAGSIQPVEVSFDQLTEWNKLSMKHKQEEKVRDDTQKGIWSMNNIADWLSPN